MNGRASGFIQFVLSCFCCLIGNRSQPKGVYRWRDWCTIMRDEVNIAYHVLVSLLWIASRTICFSHRGCRTHQ